MALIAASVPELTMRTISMDGTASMISSASCDLRLGRRAERWPRGAPLPRRRWTTRGWAVAEDERAPRADVIEVLIAVDVEEIRPFAAGDEDRLAADGAEGAGRTVDAAGDQTAGSLKRFSTADSEARHGGISSVSRECRSDLMAEALVRNCLALLPRPDAIIWSSSILSVKRQDVESRTALWHPSLRHFWLVRIVRRIVEVALDLAD